MQIIHHTEIISHDGQKAESFVFDKSVRIDESQTNIGQINRVQIIQATECLRMQVLNGTIGQFNRGDMF